jgi:2-desacetyl-2-hydroxyethyl bacteriochlorophyllide A dehydrogenase
MWQFEHEPILWKLQRSTNPPIARPPLRGDDGRTVLTIILAQPGTFRIDDRPTPAAAPPAGHALVRVRRVGICGTDWHAFHGRQPFFSYPRVLGHELGVEIEAINDPASDLKVGDRCAVEPYLNCGRCIACRRGRGNCCTDIRVLGVHTDGGMCERIVLPTRKLHRSEKLSLDQLALVETLGIGCHAVSRAKIERGEHVLVLGAGPIGLSVVPFLQAAGADVIVADVSKARLESCKRLLKVQRTVEAGPDLPKHLTDNLAGDLPTAVFDATGNPASMGRTFELMAHGGRIVFVGLFQGDVSFNDPNFHRRETTLLASRNALPEDFGRIIGMIERGEIDTTPWITHHAPAGAFLDVLPQWLKPDAGLLKAVLEF